MFPFFTQAPFLYPNFYFVDRRQALPPQFQSMFLPYGMMAQQLQNQNHIPENRLTIQN